MTSMALLDPDLRVASPLTEQALCAWVGAALPGDRLAYHRGFLAIDTSPDAHGMPARRRAELARIASRARLLAEQGLVHLVQHRHGSDDYTYLLIARPRPRASSGGALRRVLGRLDRPQPPAAACPR